MGSGASRGSWAASRGCAGPRRDGRWAIEVAATRRRRRRRGAGAGRGGRGEIGGGGEARRPSRGRGVSSAAVTNSLRRRGEHRRGLRLATGVPFAEETPRPLVSRHAGRTVWRRRGGRARCGVGQRATSRLRSRLAADRSQDAQHRQVDRPRALLQSQDHQASFASGYENVLLIDLDRPDRSPNVRDVDELVSRHLASIADPSHAELRRPVVGAVRPEVDALLRDGERAEGAFR